MAKKVAVPSLVGTTEDSAETTLNDAGLAVAKRYVSGEPGGTVYSQTPSSPGKLAKGDFVTIDILRAPEAPVAPAPVDLSGVTKSIGELNKTVAELKVSLAELKASGPELNSSVAELQASVAEIKASVGEIKTAVADHHSGEGHGSSAQPSAAKPPAKPEESSAADRSPAPAPQSPPRSTDKPAGDADS